jgi:two-component system cell cycle sensor histidine kinase/response regulator CckA
MDSAEGDGRQGRQVCAAPSDRVRAAAIAHDLNNLLAVITASVQAALRPKAPADMKGLLRDVLGAAALAAGLTRQLIDLGRDSDPGASVDVNGVVEGLGGLLRAALGPGVELDLRTWHRPLTARMSTTDLERILLNLASNARDAMPQGGSLRIEARSFASSGNRHALLVVADTGCGMDAPTVARIYEPFFTTKAGKGTGLGLATVHRLVTSSGGHIHVESEPGRGTVFRLWLPQDSAVEPSSPESPGGEP